MSPDELERLAALLHGDNAAAEQGRELVCTLAGDDPVAQARLFTQAGDLISAAGALRATALDPAATRLIACDIAAVAMDYFVSDVKPKPDRLHRDPRCDAVIAGMRAFARGEGGEAERVRLEALALAADEDDGWWETEAIYAIVNTDPLSALDDAARSLAILVHNIRRPPADAAPPAIRAAVLALLSRC